MTRHQFLGVATVPLADAPDDGSWSDNLVLSLFPDGPSQEAEHSGQCMGHLVVRVSASSPLPKGWPNLLPNLREESEFSANLPRLEFWEDSKEPPLWETQIDDDGNRSVSIEGLCKCMGQFQLKMKPEEVIFVFPELQREITEQQLTDILVLVVLSVIE